MKYNTNMDKGSVKTNWDLRPLFESVNDPKIAKLRKQVEKETSEFIKKWEKRDDYLKDPKVLKIALDEYENWLKFLGPGAQEAYYFELLFSLDQNNPEIKSRLNQSEEFSKNTINKMQFFELRIAKINPSIQKKFLQDKYLSPYKHFLEKLFLQAEHQLSEPEEKIMNLKVTTSYSNWVRMTSAFLAKEEESVVSENGKKEKKNFSEIINLMNNTNKKVRDSAAKSFNKILRKHLYVAENEINSVLQNKKNDDELRKFSRADEARLLTDDIDKEVVDNVVKTVSSKFDIAQKYYRLKADLFGVKKLKYHERNVEYWKFPSAGGKNYTNDQTIDLVFKMFDNLDNEFGKIFKDFIKNGQIDVYPSKNKRNGAFCTCSLLINPTYVLTNFTGQLRDVLTLAHEMGHAINDELIKKTQNSLNFGTPTSTAEVASTFFEDFVLQKLLENADEELKLALMVSKLNEDVSSIFRQIAFYNFETDLHKRFRENGYLANEEIGQIFQKHMISYMGSSVEQSKNSENWWIYVEHFRYFFYVYSYASGLLISKSLQSYVKKDPNFIIKVKEFLSAGLSDSPKNIFSKLKVDITDQNFWLKGIEEVNTLLKEATELAKKLGKI